LRCFGGEFGGLPDRLRALGYNSGGSAGGRRGLLEGHAGYDLDVSELEIQIPSSVLFSDLNLAYSEKQGVSFDWVPIQAICDASGVDISFFTPPNLNNVIDLLINWYGQALRNGEPRDPVADMLWSEAFSEES